MKTISAQEKDILTEVATIGLGNAISPISKIIFQEIDFSVPRVEICELEHCSEKFGDAEKKMAVVLEKISGDLTGSVLFIVEPEQALLLTSAISQMQSSVVLEEILNIVCGAALTALSKFLNFNLTQSVPASANDMLRAVVNEVLTPMGGVSNEVLLMSTDFSVKKINIKGRLCLVFDPESTDKILQKTQNAK